ncbi:MAG: glycosyltransferase [Coriobacteriia bacterium]|nr:glycosyltransferase [Coriobacteriia bacterium]
MKRLEDYRGIVEDEILADLHKRASKLYDRHIVHVNSTAQGGGVAEMLYTLIPLMNDAGVDAGWRVLVGGTDFFNVTKAFHNGLQGEPINLSEQKKRLYTQVNEAFSQYTHITTHDAVVIHDPQPLPIIKFYKKRQPWIWRCHIDLSDPNPKLWEFLQGYILRYDLMIVSHEAYLRPDLPIEQRIVNPAIDPINQKNVALPDATIARYMKRYGIPLDKPLITQVSRFDKWKDPLGVIEVYKRVRERVDCRLVLAGNMATDDPEGFTIFEKVKRRAGGLLDRGDVILMIGASDAEINALQRMSSVVLQKSLREGFGLTVSEAMWKGTPVVASAVGGIPLQVIDGDTGFLVEPNDLDLCANRIVEILTDDKLAEELAVRGKEHVRENFLITRLLGHYLALLDSVLNES